MPAKCADAPVGVNKAPTAPAGAAQRRAAVGAEDEFVPDRTRAVRTDRDGAELLRQIRIFDFSLEALLDRLARAQQEIDHDAGYEPEHDNERGENLDGKVCAPALDVAKRPDGHGEPQRDAEGGYAG